MKDNPFKQTGLTARAGACSQFGGNARRKKHTLHPLILLIAQVDLVETVCYTRTINTLA